MRKILSKFFSFQYIPAHPYYIVESCYCFASEGRDERRTEAAAETVGIGWNKQIFDLSHSSFCECPALACTFLATPFFFFCASSQEDSMSQWGKNLELSSVMRMIRNCGRGFKLSNHELYLPFIFIPPLLCFVISEGVAHEMSYRWVEVKSVSHVNEPILSYYFNPPEHPICCKKSSLQWTRDGNNIILRFIITGHNTGVESKERKWRNYE